MYMQCISKAPFPDIFQILIKHAYIYMGTRIQILYLGAVQKLQTLVIQSMLIMGEYRDMSRIYIALQGRYSNLVGWGRVIFS